MTCLTEVGSALKLMRNITIFQNRSRRKISHLWLFEPYYNRNYILLFSKTLAFKIFLCFLQAQDVALGFN